MNDIPLYSLVYYRCRCRVLRGDNVAKVPVNAKIETEMKAKLEIIAKNSSLSYADVVRMALFEYIQKYEKANGKISAEEINQILLFDKK